VNAGQRRLVDARQTFHGQTPLTARAYAPQTISGLLPATTVSSGPRLGVRSAPTTQSVLFHPSTGLQAPASLVGLDFVFAVIPVTVSATLLCAFFTESISSLTVLTRGGFLFQILRDWRRSGVSLLTTSIKTPWSTCFAPHMRTWPVLLS
jgi:hypothetical protein